MRALFYEFPEVPEFFGIDDQWLIGSNLLVKPVTESGQKSIAITLPKIDDSCNVGSSLPWYEFETLKLMLTQIVQQYPVELSTTPVFIRPDLTGAIIPRKMRLRRSSKLMFYDPYTLTIIPGKCGRAEGLLYLDDESSYAHEEQGMFAYRKFTFSGTEIRSSTYKNVIHSFNTGDHLVASPQFRVEKMVERIIVAGQSKEPKRILVGGGGSNDNKNNGELSFSYDGNAKTLTIKKPEMKVIDDWVIHLEY